MGVITATDEAGAFDEIVVEVAVKNINERPRLEDYIGEIQEGSKVGTFVSGSIQALDEDYKHIPYGKLSFKITKTKWAKFNYDTGVISEVCFKEGHLDCPKWNEGEDGENTYFELQSHKSDNAFKYIIFAGESFLLDYEGEK